MVRLRLPRRTVEYRGEPLPPELHWDAPQATALTLLSRRQLLKALGVLLAALSLPLTRVRRVAAAARGRFFTPPERATLSALCDRIFPPDQGPDGKPSPGAKMLGAPVYIERMLAAFTFPVPLIYAGGPFSNRNPFPDNKRGVPSRRRPKNDFRHFIPPSRVQTIRWRAEILGSAATPGADFNDAALGPLVGLQQVYRDGLKRVDEIAQAMAGAPFAKLSTDDQDRVLGMLQAPGAFPNDRRRGNATFIDLLGQHTLEGCFAPPEYGGNRHRLGWKMIGLEGDDQPLGYSIYWEAVDDYNEIPAHPMSTSNPDELAAPRPLSADGDSIQDTIASFANGVSMTE